MGEQLLKRQSRLLNILLLGPFGLILVVLPLFMIVLRPRRPAPQPLDLETVITFSKWLDKQMEKKHGPSSPVRYPDFGDEKYEITGIDNGYSHNPKPPYKLRFDPLFERVIRPKLYAPILDLDIERLHCNAEQWMDRLELIYASGHPYRPYHKIKDSASGARTWEQMSRDCLQMPDIFEAMDYTNFRLVLARKAASNAEWEEVFVQLDLAAQAVEVMRSTRLSNFGLLATKRNNVYRTAELFLADNVPLEIKRRAANWLTGTRTRDPIPSDLNVFEEKRYILYLAMTYYDKSAQPKNPEDSLGFMIEPAVHLANQNRHYENPSMDGLAKSFRRKFKLRHTGIPLNEFNGRDAEYFMRMCAEQEPFIQSFPLMTADFWSKHSDSMTKLYIGMPYQESPGCFSCNDGAAKVAYYLTLHCHAASWQGYMLEAALAAQIFHAEVGRWPRSHDDLQLGAPPDLIPERDLLYSDWDREIFGNATRESPFTALSGRIRCGWIEPTDELLNALRMARLPMQFLDDRFLGELVYRREDGTLLRKARGNAQPPPDTDGCQQTIKLVYSPNSSVSDEDNLILFGAIEQILASEPNLVQSAQSYASFAYEPDEQDTALVMDRVREAYVAGNVDRAKTYEKMIYPNQNSDAYTTSGLVRYELFTMARMRELADAQQEWRWTIGKPGDIPDDRPDIVHDPDAVGPELPWFSMLDIKWKTPTRIFAVWSPGPDGDDDGGQVAYDPTNGSISNGDLIQFVDY